MNVIDQWRIATKRLSETDSIMKNIIETYNGEKMKLRGVAFETLARSIVGQQISVKAADSVWKKLEKLCQSKIGKEKILSLPHDKLKSTGLSNQKAIYLRNIAESDILETKWDTISDKCQSLNHWAKAEIIKELDVREVSSNEFTAKQMSSFFLKLSDDPIKDQLEFYRKYKIQVPFISWNNQTLFRISIQVYNTKQDIYKLIQALKDYI